jgi:hypothetical protein
MASLLTPAQTNLPELSSRVLAQFASVLAALLMGGAMLLGNAVSPDAQIHPVMTPVAAAIPTASELDAAWHNADRTPESASRLIPTVNGSQEDRRSMAVMGPDRTRVEMETALATDTRAVSAPLATIPLRPGDWDVRWGLMEMAAAQRRDWILGCPCPVHSVEGPRSGPR